jgi:hypothetical protein
MKNSKIYYWLTFILLTSLPNSSHAVSTFPGRQSALVRQLAVLPLAPGCSMASAIWQLSGDDTKFPFTVETAYL